MHPTGDDENPTQGVTPADSHRAPLKNRAPRSGMVALKISCGTIKMGLGLPKHKDGFFDASNRDAAAPKHGGD